MAFVSFLRSTPARMARVLVGFALIAYGATQGSLVGLILMMIGVVLAVTGIAGMCLSEKIAKVRKAAEAVPRRTHERRA